MYPKPKKTPQQRLGILLIVIGVPLLLAFGFGLLLIGLGIALYVYGKERCTYCKARGKIRPVNSEIVRQEHGFGIVTRNERVTGRVGRQRQQSVVQRQERVPTVKTVTRVTYRCTNCQQGYSREYVSQAEDFSRSGQEQTIIQREVLKIPCKYCKTLLDPIRDKKCPNCGAVMVP